MSDVLNAPAPKAVKLKPEARGLVAAVHEGRTPPYDPERLGAWINAADWLIECGQLQAAESVLAALHEAQPGIEWAENIRELLQRAPPLPPDAAGFQDDALMDVQVAPRPGARTALILFCGARHRMGMPLPLIHRWLARLDASLIYLRDFHGLCYLNGVVSLGRTLEETTAALRRRLAELGATRVVCFGCSGGGFGALRYALELEGDAVSFGSPTNMEPVFNAHMNHAAVAGQLKAAFPGEDLDLRRRAEAARRPPRTLIAYGERNWNERIHAEHMAGAPGAILHPVTGYAGHATAAELIRRGAFEPMLRDFLAGEEGHTPPRPGA